MLMVSASALASCNYTRKPIKLEDKVILPGDAEILFQGECQGLQLVVCKCHDCKLVHIATAMFYTVKTFDIPEEEWNKITPKDMIEICQKGFHMTVEHEILQSGGRTVS